MFNYVVMDILDEFGSVDNFDVLQSSHIMKIRQHRNVWLFSRRQWLAARRDASKMPCAEDTLHALRLKVTVSHLQPHAMG